MMLGRTRIESSKKRLVPAMRSSSDETTRLKTGTRNTFVGMMTPGFDKRYIFVATRN
ncbi:hypothetical protein CASFOL_034577 [Castilleja foliolosa]|uniref:Uncharacterized protein n=1 Tax=Castilleja foliolosa TaxID=1961234 RepID=A0ABD3BQA9_9LAMI